MNDDEQAKMAGRPPFLETSPDPEISAIPQPGQSLADDLTLLMASHSREAFSRAYQYYSASIYSLALRRVKDAVTAEDIVQEVFVKLWKSRKEISATRGSLESWLYITARNAIYDELRKRQRSDPAKEFDVTVPSPDVSALDHIVTREQVLRLLQHLPWEQQRVVDLIVIQGYTGQEAAKLLAIPAGTVKSRFRLAMAKLKQRFGREDRD